MASFQKGDYASTQPSGTAESARGEMIGTDRAFKKNK